MHDKFPQGITGKLTDLSKLQASPQRIVFPWQNSVEAKFSTCTKARDVTDKRRHRLEMSQAKDITNKSCQKQEISQTRDVTGKKCNRQEMSHTRDVKDKDVTANPS